MTGAIAFAGLLAFLCFNYTQPFWRFPAQIQRSVHLGFALGLIFAVSGDKRFAEDRQIQSRLV
ncbi:hypothetical protein PO124_34740 [Bacillus licheniformis]|nr:hypothetical protein [Bacillus licheniformis]